MTNNSYSDRIIRLLVEEGTFLRGEGVVAWSRDTGAVEVGHQPLVE